MSMVTPSYANALLAQTIPQVEADLLSRFPTTILQGWSPDAPQRQLLSSDAQSLQFEQIQRAAMAYAASPVQVQQLRAFLVAKGYDAGTAAALASAWVDVALSWYQTPRLPATAAVWQVSVTATSPQTINAQSQIVLQALDGMFFQSAQVGDVVLNSGNAFTGLVSFSARSPGTTGNVPAGSIAFVNQGPAGLSVNTSIAQVLLTPARDVEIDEDALGRALGRWGTLSAILTRDGWRFVMQTPSVGGVATLTQIFVDDTNPLGPGSVRIAVANATGGTTAAELAAAQSQGAKFTLAGGGPVGVIAAPTLTVAISAVLKTDGSNPLAAAQGASALVQLAGKVGDANVLYVDAVIRELMAIAGVVNITTLSLTADVPRPPSTAFVISPTVTQT